MTLIKLKKILSSRETQKVVSDFMGLLGTPAAIEGLSYWTDAALLSAAGIPSVCYGPGDIRLAHSATEWVPVSELHRATAVLAQAAVDWFGVR